MTSKNRSKYIRSLKQKKYRQKYNKFVCEGGKIVREVLKRYPDRVDEVFGTADFISSQKRDWFESITEIDPDLLQQISSLESNREAIAVCDIPDHAIPERFDLAFFLDAVRDPGNLGTIIRVCDWFGLNDLFISPDSVDPYNPKVVQATMGSIFKVRLHQISFEDLVEHFPHYDKIATDMRGVEVSAFNANPGSIVVLGSESHGIEESVKEQCATTISIPGHPERGAESLNVGVAAGIIAAFLNK